MLSSKGGYIFLVGLVGHLGQVGGNTLEQPLLSSKVGRISCFTP